jgi:tripartite-type tricarboxylate transporter receptor subunit TctC
MNRRSHLAALALAVATAWLPAAAADAAWPARPVHIVVPFPAAQFDARKAGIQPE